MSDKTGRFYIIQREYVGPGREDAQFFDKNTWEITNVPARGNGSGEVCTDGWCGETNGWSVMAHGEFRTLEGAREVLKLLLSDGCRDRDAQGYPFDGVSDGAIEVYKAGLYDPMTVSQTEDWIRQGIRDDIKASTTDAELQELDDEYEVTANEQGFTLSAACIDLMTKYRDSLRPPQWGMTYAAIALRDDLLEKLLALPAADLDHAARVEALAKEFGPETALDLYDVVFSAGRDPYRPADGDTAGLEADIRLCAAYYGPAEHAIVSDLVVRQMVAARQAAVVGGLAAPAMLKALRSIRLTTVDSATGE